MKTTTTKMALPLAFAATPLALAHTAGDCAGFTWDLSREFAAFSGQDAAATVGITVNPA